MIGIFCFPLWRGTKGQEFIGSLNTALNLEIIKTRFLKPDLNFPPLEGKETTAFEDQTLVQGLRGRNLLHKQTILVKQYISFSTTNRSF